MQLIFKSATQTSVAQPVLKVMYSVTNFGSAGSTTAQSSQKSIEDNSLLSNFTHN